VPLAIAQANPRRWPGLIVMGGMPGTGVKVFPMPVVLMPRDVTPTACT
jgi:hypothetical protein